MKRFIIKVCLFTGIICVLQYTLTQVFPPPLSQEVTRIRTAIAAHTDIIYLGDSTNWVAHPTDTDRRYISMFLESLLPDRTIQAITDPAYNPDVYLEYVRYIGTNASYPKPLIIIPINLITFSPMADRRPYYQYQHLKDSLRFADSPLLPFLRFIFTIQAFPLVPISEKEFLDTPVYNGKLQVGTVRDFEGINQRPYSDDNLRKLLVYFYMFDLSPSHRKIRSLEEIADIIRTNSMNVIFYVTPIDYETGVHYLGPIFQERLNQNVSVITWALKQKGFRVLDLSSSLPANGFAWKNAEFTYYINEHLNDQGRLFVATQLQKKVEEILPEH